MNMSDIYVNVELPPRNHSKWTKGVTSSENIYGNTCPAEPRRPRHALSGAGGAKKSRCRVAAVCVLFLLLLSGLITLVVLYTKGILEWKMENALLHNSFKDLTQELDQSQTSLKNLTNELEQLQASCKNLSEYRDRTQKRLESMTEERNVILSQPGWTYFSGSLYHISSQQKSWQDSRDDCLQRGSDLVIINNRQEQEFTRRFREVIWIGLSDRANEGTWKWVDGTPLITSFWASGEPNGDQNQDEDCAQIKTFDMVNSWNDESCKIERFWMCEKKLSQ